MRRRGPGVFLDRDGVVNEAVLGASGPLQTTFPYNFTYRDGVIDGISALSDAGFQVFVVTNKPCISWGVNNLENEMEIAEKVFRETAVTAYFLCPHSEEDGCTCRKPGIGWLLEAERRHCVDLRRSWFVGDKESDILCGRRAGTKTVLMDYDHNRDVQADFRVRNFPEAVEVIRKHAGFAKLHQGDEREGSRDVGDDLPGHAVAGSFAAELAPDVCRADVPGSWDSGEGRESARADAA